MMNLADIARAIKKDVDWSKIRELVMRWAQDDGTGDEFSDLVTGGSEEGPSEELWAEFEERLKKAFG